MFSINCSENYSKMLVLIQLSFIYYLGIQGMVDVPSCIEPERRISTMIGSIFDKRELPSDLQPLVEILNDSNTTVLLQNCSDLLTLKHYLYDCATRPNKTDLPKHYYTALYPFVEMKYQILNYKTYIPKTNADIILLTNSFASTSLNPVLERKLHLYFFYYGNWLENLTERNFPFHKYKNPRFLFLDMICELINDPLYRMYEREVIFFLILNNHTCSFIENYYRHTNKFHNMYHGDFHNKLPEKADNYANKISNNKTSNHSNNIILFQNFSITILNNKVLPNTSFVQTGNESKLFLNFSIVNSIKLKPINSSHVSLKEYQTPNTTTEIPNLSSLNITTASWHETTQTMKILNPNQTKIPIDNSSARNLGKEETGPPRYDLNILQQNHSNLSHLNATHSDINQKYQQIENQHIHNFTVWDIVEMDGPCKEGQQHVVKLNVQSLLTAIDKHVSNSSLELFRRLLNNVKSFPIEDYNARGELLRDLLLVISKEQADPLIKKSIEDILDHVILDGAGALPPKIKLECMNSPEGNLKRPARRTRRLFDLQFD